MTNLPKEVHAIVALRDGAETGTALTIDDLSILATDLLDARIEAYQQGLFMLQVEAADDGSGDETYEIALTGRPDSGAAYVDLATITVTRGAPGLGFHVADVDGFERRLNYRLDVGAGTTPSITFSAWVVVTYATYQPLGAVIITA